MTLLDRIAAWTGCNKQYWEGVAICREHGQLSERDLRMLDRGMTTCKQEEIINAEVARIKQAEQKLHDEAQHSTVQGAETDNEGDHEKAAE